MAPPLAPLSDPNPYHSDFKFNAEMESLAIPPLDPQFFESDNGMASDTFMLDPGFGFGSEDNCHFELTFDDLDNLYLPSDADGLDPPAAALNLDSGSPQSGSSAISISGTAALDSDVSRFLKFPSSNNEFSSETSGGGPVSSHGSAISEAAVKPTSDSGNSGNSINSVSSNVIFRADDEMVKAEDEMAKNSVVKRKKKETSEEEGNVVESRSTKYQRSDNNNNNNASAIANTNDEEEKRKARLVRNRESAHLSRQRKKHYVEELEDKVRAMHSTIADLNSRISYVMAENATLKQQFSSGGGNMFPLPPHSGMHPPMPPMGYPWMPYSPYVVKPQGSQVPLVPIPRLKPLQPAAAPKPKKSESKKTEGKTKKVASISFLGMLFFILLFGGLVPMVNVNFGGVMDRGSPYVSDRFYNQNGATVLTVHGHLNGSEENIGSGISGGKFDVSNKIPHERGHMRKEKVYGQKEQGSHSKPGSDEFFRMANTSSDPLVASLYVPRNDKLVKIDGNLIIHSVMASEKAMASHGHSEKRNGEETGLAMARDLASALAIPEAGGNRGRRAPLYRNSAGPHKALTAGSTDVSKEHMKSTVADGRLQTWFREGLAGPMLSSGMCTEVFQFDVSASSPSGGIIPASSVPNASEHCQNTTELNRGRNRRILRGLPIPLAGSNHNVTEENVTRNQQNNTLPGNTSVSPMVVSVLVDPREAGDIDVDGMMNPKSVSRIFVVVLLDTVKYVTYSCVLPRAGPHLVTT